MTTHDLRNKQWSYVPQANPDGIVSIIRIENAGTVRAGDFLLIGNTIWNDKWTARYLVQSASKDRLHCVQASRTLAEIARASSPEALQEAM